MTRSVRTSRRRARTRQVGQGGSSTPWGQPNDPVEPIERVRSAEPTIEIALADGPNGEPEDPRPPLDWSNRLARLLLRAPLVGHLDNRLAPIVNRGRLDSTDALAGLLRFATVGGLATSVYFGIAIGLHLAGVGPNTTSTVAIVISVVVSFIMQSRVTFQTRRFDLAEAARFGVVGIIGLTVSRLTIGTVHLRAGQPFWVAALIVCLIVPLTNFAAMNFWVFAGGRNKANAEKQR